MDARAKLLGHPVHQMLVVFPLGLLATGCSGINTSHSVSPASFFLPGLMQADPPPATDQPAAPTAEPVLVAQSR